MSINPSDFFIILKGQWLYQKYGASKVWPNEKAIAFTTQALNQLFRVRDSSLLTSGSLSKGSKKGKEVGDSRKAVGLKMIGKGKILPAPYRII